MLPSSSVRLSSSVVKFSAPLRATMKHSCFLCNSSLHASSTSWAIWESLSLIAIRRASEYLSIFL